MLLATHEQVMDNGDVEKAPYSPRAHAGLLIDGDESFEDMEDKWRLGAVAFQRRTPFLKFRRDSLPPFLVKKDCPDGVRVRVSLKSHFWEHPQYGSWYVIPNHLSRFHMPAKGNMETVVTEPIRHKGYTDRGVYGYEVQFTFGKDIKRTVTFSLYEPFKRAGLTD